MGKTLNNQKSNSERKYLNMLHVWEEIILSASQRKNHIAAFNQGINDYHQFLDSRYHLYKLGKVQKQHVSKLLGYLIENFPSGLIPAGTIIFELRTDEGNELYDKVAVLYFSEENEPVFLDDPYISKFYSNHLFSNRENSFLCLQLVVTESDNKNNEVTLAILNDSSPFPYPDDFIELFKSPNEKVEALHDIAVLL